MARPLRIEYEHALHHVISRGDNRRRIVSDDAGHEKRLAWLERVDADASAWFAGRRIISADRALVAFVAMTTYGYRGKELSDALGYRSQSSVPAAIRRVESSTSLRRAAAGCVVRLQSGSGEVINGVWRSDPSSFQFPPDPSFRPCGRSSWEQLIVFDYEVV